MSNPDILESKKSSQRLARTLQAIKNVLNKQPEGEENIFAAVLEEVKALISYEQAVVLLLEGDSLIVRHSENMQHFECSNYCKKFTSKDKNLLNVVRNRSSVLENEDLSITAELGIDFGAQVCSIAVMPLFIREMVYGMLVLTRKNESFSPDDVTVLDALMSAASYLIKDAELSSVFRMQLGILKNSISQRTKALELIKEQNEKILEADRIKNEFLSNMSHELRTPLNAVIGLSEALSMKIFGDLNEKQAEYVDDIHASGRHLLDMINDLLDLSKIESGKMELNREIFDVKVSLDEVISIVKPLADKKAINMRVTEKNKRVKINADKRKFHQILYNLLSNAIKFTGENGNIVVTLSINGDELKCSVKDDGIGIAPEYHDKIFEKFHQVRASLPERQSSTGLGLTITKELIEMHSGKIKLESEEGKGANFIFTLPLKERIKNENSRY